MHTAIALFLICVAILLLSQPVAAFGAGDIPDFAYLNDRAFRHGDIESVLTNLAKNVGGAAAGGGLMGFAASVISSATGGSKFSKMDVKRVYFGNWLRDYSQAMDIAGLSKLTAQTLVTIVTVLGFMTFGFATAEFEVTADRLGVYLPVEHIDNPKGYAEKEGDARQFHPKLRPPVDREELEINPRNGMKNYIATERQSWDTSTAHVRRTLQQCIEYGRRARGEENNDQWEAFRLLGTALHTLEDLLAHSNWCELALRKLGHEQVFCHVGEEVIINTPNGQAPPLVTGTFGSADFMHSVMGEGMDHLSEASVTNLTGKMDEAKTQGDGPISTLKSLLSKLPSSGNSSNDQKMEQAEDIKRNAYNFNPNDVAPEDVQRQLWQVLEWRDGIYRDIVNKIEMIPGLSDILDELTNALNAYVFTVLEPMIKPMLEEATGVLQDGSKAVIDSDDQFEVFNNPRASDPSHSMLSKDHFGLILNEPAGKIAQVVVEYSVNLIVKAWYDENEDPNRIIDQILETFHHPYFATGNSEIQRLMMNHLERWISGLSSDERQQTIQALSKESVRAGKNKRLGSDDGTQGAQAPSGEYGNEQSQIRHSNDNTYGRAETTREDQYGNGGYGDVRYTPHAPSQPTYNRYDGQQRDEPERHRRADADDDASSRDQYGEGRRGGGRRRADDGDGDGGDASYADPARGAAHREHGARQPRGEPHGRDRHAEPRDAEDGGYGDARRGAGDDARRQAGAARVDGRETYRPAYDAGGQAYDGGREAYGGGQEAYGGGREAYGGGGESYGGERSQSYGRAQEYAGGGNESYGGGNQSYSGGRQSYGREEELGGNRPYDGGQQAYGAGGQAYGAGGQAYGGGQRASGDGNQPHGAGRRAFGDGDQPYGGGNEAYGVRQAYGGEAQADTGRRGGGYGREEDTSYGAVEGEGYARGDRREAGRGSYEEGAGYGAQARPNYAEGRRHNHGGHGGHVDAETFGAEGLSLEDDGRRHGQPGYGRGLRRDVDDYLPQ